MRTGGGRSLDGMMEIARDANQQFKEPLMDAEVVKIVTSAWQHDAPGLNFFTRPRVMLNHDIVDALADSNALVLLVKLERYHGGNDHFILSKAMADSMGWTLPRWEPRDPPSLKPGSLNACILVVAGQTIHRSTPGR